MKKETQNKNQKFHNLQYKSQNSNGITLIALVVTIIVLLILAAISITAVFGENGLITKADKAKKETEKGMADDTQGIKNLGNFINAQTGNNIIDVIYVESVQKMYVMTGDKKIKCVTGTNETETSVTN